MRGCSVTKVSFLFKYIYKENGIGIAISTGTLRNET